ncbi:helix-turn-helix domain-containing protein [Blastomonas sp.]|uniref:helix-turn-helix domain-containing protein n=1 Tax=Blastomonas sp. TaxID=1909299 RepID=UPI00391A928C
MMAHRAIPSSRQTLRRSVHQLIESETTKANVRGGHGCEQLLCLVLHQLEQQGDTTHIASLLAHPSIPHFGVKPRLLVARSDDFGSALLTNKSIQNASYRALVDGLRDGRRAARLTQTELAASLGRSQQFVSKYESLERRLDVIELVQIAQALTLDWRQLIQDVIDEANP